MRNVEDALVSLYVSGRKRFTPQDIEKKVDSGYKRGRIDVPLSRRDLINSSLLHLQAGGYIVLRRDTKEKQFTLYGGDFTDKMEDYCRAMGVMTKKRVREKETCILSEACPVIRSPLLREWIYKEMQRLSFASIDKFDPPAFIKGIFLADGALCNEGVMYERDFAKKVLNDSKGLQAPARSCMERILQQCAGDDILAEYEERKKVLGSSAQILPLFGIIKTPQYVFMQGDLSIHMDNGVVLKTYGYPFSVSSEYIDDIKRIDVHSGTILTIENKTTYEDCHMPDTLKVFVSGFLSFPARILLSKIYEGNPDKRYLHWSDIDGGGIRIFRHVKKYLPTVRPYRMDIASLKENEGSTTPLTENDRYFLSGCTDDPYFGETARYMLDNNVKLEQESFYQ